ncbi:STAS/SEC14 domain-containing protein [Rickettsiales bacterium LUAb2]
MFKITNHKNHIHIKVTGKVSHKDYTEHLMPELNKEIKDNKNINVLVEATDFNDWEYKAVLDDLKTSIKHRKDFNKVAIVGNKSWEEFLSNFFSMFMRAQIKYFDSPSLNEAEEWVKA